jgi:hypothetical protein
VARTYSLDHGRNCIVIYSELNTNQVGSPGSQQLKETIRKALNGACGTSKVVSRTSLFPALQYLCASTIQPLIEVQREPLPASEQT